MKIGVFDIGTKALKLIIGDAIPNIGEPLDFSLYQNNGKLTYLGDAVQNDIIDPRSMIQTISYIKTLKQEAEMRHVDKFLAVGTAVFRNIKNKDEIISLIKDKTNLDDINILSQEQEAKYSMIAALFSSGGSLKKNEVCMLIDQGGGSTEIGFAKYLGKNNFEIQHLESINFGSLDFKEKVLSNPGNLKKAVGDVALQVKDIVKKHKKFKTNDNIKIFGMGSGITALTKQKSNKKQHGKEFPYKSLTGIIEKNNNRKMKAMTMKPSIINEEDSILFDQYCLEVLTTEFYSGMLKKYKTTSIRVCGAGLRYGVLFSHLIENK
jgi:exopolyphosphatase/pppGpp-phosphohydrolase